MKVNRHPKSTLLKTKRLLEEEHVEEAMRVRMIQPLQVLLCRNSCPKRESKITTRNSLDLVHLKLVSTTPRQEVNLTLGLTTLSRAQSVQPPRAKLNNL